MTNEDRAEWGVRAMEAGTPDYEANELATNAIDTIANVLHAAHADHPDRDPRALLESALMHFADEISEQED